MPVHTECRWHKVSVLCRSSSFVALADNIVLATRLWPNDTVYDPESAMIEPDYGIGGALFSSSG